MKIPYIALYPSDFIADTYHLGNTELGIYWRLLLFYYLHRQPLPYDLNTVCRIAYATSPEERKAVEFVLTEFFTVATDAEGRKVWRHHRADEEIERALERVEVNHARTRAATEARKIQRDDERDDVRHDQRDDVRHDQRDDVRHDQRDVQRDDERNANDPEEEEDPDLDKDKDLDLGSELDLTEVGSERSTHSEPTPLPLPKNGSLKNGEQEFITIPLVDRTEAKITEKEVREWEEAYPAVNVRQELREIRQWNLSNPRRRKTRHGWRNHVTEWLGREQDRGQRANGKEQLNASYKPPPVTPEQEQRAREAHERLLAEKHDRPTTP
jgi:uncharacterized protein YdaU (DUF1376 family)